LPPPPLSLPPTPQFTGLTREEFKAWIGRGYSKSKRGLASTVVPALKHDGSKDVPVEALPPALDWRSKGVVTKVKDQGSCGGCWSFSAAETLESHIAINTGKLFVLSEQELLSCTPDKQDCGGTGGCNGATQELAFAYVSQAGITTEQQWPYEAVTGTCAWGKKTPVANITGYVELPVNNYTALMNAVQTMPIAISAAAEPWMSYETGVFNSDCGSDVDHAIVLEGYGHDSASGLDYYLVRNSWSASWGEEGYIRIVRVDSPTQPCLEDKTPGDGDGCKGGPSEITVCGECGILSDSSYPTGGHLI
jgi:cathepsin L